MGKVSCAENKGKCEVDMNFQKKCYNVPIKTKTPSVTLERWLICELDSEEMLKISMTKK